MVTDGTLATDAAKIQAIWDLRTGIAEAYHRDGVLYRVSHQFHKNVSQCALFTVGTSKINGPCLNYASVLHHGILRAGSVYKRGSILQDPIIIICHFYSAIRAQTEC